ncbi:MAG TPA: ABC transporter permease, partial [Candidatus Polarisedimenticolia bacterium]|nr:ABC transporter permease [Candidatus Polarisedimenticolia bacterium]
REGGMNDWLRLARVRLPRLSLPPARELEVLQELADLLEDAYDDAVRRGAGHEEAMAFAERQIPQGEALARWIEEAERPVAARLPQALRGEHLHDRLAESQSGAFVNGVLLDVRYAGRMIARAPAFSLLAILTLALGIGANTAIFTVVNEALLRPRPGIGSPESLVDIGRSDQGGGFDNMSYPNFTDFRERSTAFAEMAALNIDPRAMSLDTGDGSERIDVSAVSGNYFDLLQVRAQAGRFFLPEEDRTPGTHPVVVLSDALWRKRFQGDPGIVGRDITLNGLAYAVVGVAAPGFHGTVPVAIDAWVPMMMGGQVYASKEILDCRDCSFMLGIGRLKPGATLAQARAEADAIATSLRREHPEEVRERGIALLPSRLFPGEMQTMVAAFLALLMTIVGLVLTIASVNVAGMMLVRASARRREIAVRLALGAGRARVVRQMVIEGVMLFAAAGTAGLLLAVWMRDGLVALLPALPIPVVFDLGLDGRVVAFGLGVALVAGLLASIVPALQASRPDLVAALKDDAHAAGSRKARLRNALVLGQVALSLLLLVCAGLFLRALSRAATLDPGFEMKDLHVLAFDFSLAGMNDAQGIDASSRLLDRVHSLPGVGGAAWAWSVPLDGGGRGLGDFRTPGIQAPDGTESWNFDWSVISPGYFATMGIPVLRGRDFTDADDAAGRRVAVVNETAARAIWPDRDPVGQLFKYGDPRNPDSMTSVEVVGVVRDQKYRSLGDGPRNFVFLPIRQQFIPNVALMLRTTDARATLPAVRAAVRTMHPDVPVLTTLSMQEYAALSLFPQKVASWVAGSLGLVGLLLVGLGVYGVIAFSVQQRTREIGVRMALGARRADVLRMVLGQGLRLTAWGTGAGLLLAAVATQMLSALLYDVSALDPITFAGVAALVLLVAALATLVPARRATRVDPLVALRDE